MKKARGQVLRTEWLAVNKLVVARYYNELFPLPRDLSRLRQGFEQYGYKPEYPIVAWMKGNDAQPLEIVCGVGRYTIAKERGMRRVPVIVRQFDDENQAQVYSIEDNLYNAASSARISLVHAISLARILKARGGQYSAQRIWECAGVSESTFWRAVSSLDSMLQEAIISHPEIAEIGFSRQISEIVRRDLYPDFTRLFAGEVEVHTFHKAHGKRTLSGARKTAPRLHPPAPKQVIRGSHNLSASLNRTASSQNAGNAVSDKTTQPTRRTIKPSKGKKRIDKDRAPSLFDL